jgi:hypothetical protein
MPNSLNLTANSSTSGATAAIDTTKVRVTANAAVHYAVGSSPVAYAGNCEIIPANSTRYINMEGLGNKIAFITGSGSAEVSVTKVGYVSPTSIPAVQSG